MNHLPTRRTRGFTLLELIIVVALLAALASLSWPALRKLSYRGRLQDAARQLRIALVRARLDAIESGRVHLFRYQPGTGYWEVTAADSDASAVDVVAQIEPSSRAAGGPPGPGDFAAAPAAACELSGGVCFVVPDAGRVASSGARDFDAAPTPAAGWSEPIVFLPNGRTVNARLSLVNTPYRVDLMLRGLTGTVSIGQVQRAEASAAAPRE